MAQTISAKLAEMMNQAIAREMQVSIQYMWQHVMAKGLNSPKISDMLKGIAVSEMKHAEKIAERLFYFNVTPTAKLNSVQVGGDIKQMLEINVKEEEQAIALYRSIIQQALSEADVTTGRLFEEILSDEEGHHHTFQTLLAR